jgi:transposase
MRGPKPPAIELDEAERTDLERLARRPSTSQQIAQRARMILAAAAGANNSAIAVDEGVDVDTVRRWRMRWLGLRAAAEDLPAEDRLSDVPRPGRPARITAEQTCQLVALAGTAPRERPISQWTGREIADEAVHRGIVPAISPRHARRLLKRGHSNRIGSATG